MLLKDYVFTKDEAFEMLDIYAYKEFGDDLSDVILRYWNNESACGFAILNNGDKRYIFTTF